jgi:two-component system, OmpR family, sensor histidine kinase ChvG
MLAVEERKNFVLRSVIVVAIVIAIFSLFLNAYIIKPIRLLNIFANDTSPEKKNMNVVHKIETRTDEIGNLSRSLNEMTSKLYNRIDLAERFASDLTHEIRNPLASLKGASELLNNTSDNLKREKLLKIVSNDVDRIERLITDYSQVLKDEASQSRSIPKDFDLVSVIESVIEDFNTDTKTMDKNISIRFENLLQNNKAIIFGIESRIEQVIANVLENAISFSPIKSEVEISLSKKNNLVQMLIRDKGPGFDEKNVNKIFERFYSDRPDLSSVNHSGLGLNIVKNIIDSHKGSIEAYNYYKNKKLGGAVIDIKLPSKN